MTNNTFHHTRVFEDRTIRLKPEITAFLDRGAASFQAGEDVEETITMVVDSLQKMRRALPTRLWKEFATIECRWHPLIDFVLQDPLTQYSYIGLSSDTLDLMYDCADRHQPLVLEESSELGRHIFRATSNLQVSRLVRARRRILTEKLNELDARKPKPQVLALACGHLREAQYCPAVREGRISRYIAIDQDKANLAVVEREMQDFGVETVNASVKDLLTGRAYYKGFDFIYSAGLFDSIPDDVGQELIAFLFGILNPGGQLLFSNFTPSLNDSGYMETYMDWWLTYRTKAQLLHLAATLPDEKIEAIYCFTEGNSQVAFIEIEKR
jgi:extracellular factor (EF) 3-hydroxypalmitic acid methyl ester biosynthesis protein